MFLGECLYKLQLFEYDRIDMSEGIDANKTTDLPECITFHYWYFLEINFRFQLKACEGKNL